MKNCELCSGGLARMHCESDQANLCWDCDLKVHGANFLVAKHARALLCHVCQNPTPWLASGHRITPGVSVCQSCISTKNTTAAISPDPEESSEGECEDEGQEDYYDEHVDEDEQEEEEAENQVVPWSGDSSSFSISKPVPLASSDCVSSSGGDGGDDGGFGLKRRKRESLGFCSDDEIGCSSSHGESSSSSTSASRLLKQPRLADEVNNLARNQEHGETESRSTAIISSLKRLQKHMIINDDDASAAIIRICRLSKD